MRGLAVKKEQRKSEQEDKHEGAGAKNQLKNNLYSTKIKMPAGVGYNKKSKMGNAKKTMQKAKPKKTMQAKKPTKPKAKKKMK